MQGQGRDDSWWLGWIISQFSRQQTMKQKSLSVQSQRPKIIKLIPFTPLPKLHLSPLISSTSHATPLPFISTAKTKAKTSPSQGQFRRERIKTQQMSSKQEDSAGFRLLSRFIYNHLQKKLAFQTHLCTNFHESLSGADGDNMTMDSQQRFREEIYAINCNRGQSYIGNPVKEASRSQVLKLKNRLTVRAKALQRLANESKPERSRNRYANIDSYFDLSCLDSCQRGR